MNHSVWYQQVVTGKQFVDLLRIDADIYSFEADNKLCEDQNMYAKQFEELAIHFFESYCRIDVRGVLKKEENIQDVANRLAPVLDELTKRDLCLVTRQVDEQIKGKVNSTREFMVVQSVRYVIVREGSTLGFDIYL